MESILIKTGVMKQKNIVRLGMFFLAVIVLVITVVSVSSIKYAHTPFVLSGKAEAKTIKKVDYELPYSGKIHPDSPFWYLKVLRDKLWLSLNFKAEEKAKLNLLFANKRLLSSLELFKKNKPDLGLSTLTKAEKYLENSWRTGETSGDPLFYKNVANASLKHRELIEQEIMPICPEDLRPFVVLTLNKTKEIYRQAREKLISNGLVPPENPFD